MPDVVWLVTSLLFIKLRYTEIQDFHVAILIDENILWLNIPINYIILVSIGQSLQQLNNDIDLVRMRDLIDLGCRAQIDALYVLHDEVGHLIRANSAVENMNNIRMCQSRDNI